MGYCNICKKEVPSGSFCPTCGFYVLNENKVADNVADKVVDKNFTFNENSEEKSKDYFNETPETENSKCQNVITEPIQSHIEDYRAEAIAEAQRETEASYENSINETKLNNFEKGLKVALEANDYAKETRQIGYKSKVNNKWAIVPLSIGFILLFADTAEGIFIIAVTILIMNCTKWIPFIEKTLSKKDS